MMNISKPFLTNFKHFENVENVFNKEECQYISSLGWRWEDALTQGRFVRDDEVRNSDVFWLSPTQDNIWIWERIKHFIEYANSYIWKMNLENFPEHLQLTRYTKNGHYDWHVDNGNEKSSHRKLSCVVNLTDETKFIGGGTSIKTGNKPEILPKTQGSMNIFPSYVLHKANEIKKGKRLSLVCWVGGSHYC